MRRTPFSSSSVLSLRTCLALFLLVLSTAASGEDARTQARQKAKEAALAGVDAQKKELVGLSEKIWDFAETALREHRSAEALADYAEAQGFEVERGVAGMPTAFVASYGEGRPVLGILGEFDALPGLSQEAVPDRKVRHEGEAGHGCGHNLFGPASLGAAVAIQRLIESGQLFGTVRFFGTPAEESVSGKVYMAREGLFSDLDAAIAWHPDTKLRVDTGSSQAMVDFVVEFKGRTAHAAFDPWNGRSAVDGLEIATHALNLLREHVRPSVRIHYAILGGGDVPNVVPETSRLWCWVRDSKRSGVEEVMERVEKIVQGAALAADVEGQLKIQSGVYELLTNFAGARAMQKNLESLGPVQWSEEDQAFARRLQESSGVEPLGLSTEVEPLDENPGDPRGGSTDVADVSWLVPTIHFSAPAAPVGIPWHAWPVVASAGSPVGQRGMHHAARAMALTLVDLFTDENLRAEMRREFEVSTEGHTYRPYIPEGPPPIPEP